MCCFIRRVKGSGPFERLLDQMLPAEWEMFHKNPGRYVPLSIIIWNIGFWDEISGCIENSLEPIHDLDLTFFSVSVFTV